MSLNPRRITLIIFLAFTSLRAQNPEIERLMEGELKMTFPSIYFKSRSTDYAAMPYTVDSCLKYIATNFKNISGYFIWRDSSETEKITGARIKKLNAGLAKYKLPRKIFIESMGKEQKISR